MWRDYRGEEVIGFAMFDDLHKELGVGWALVAEVDTHEAFAAVMALRNWSIAVGLVFGIMTLLTAYLISRAIARPIVALAQASQRIGAGDLRVEITSDGRINEIGVLEKAFMQMRNDLRELLGNVQAGAQDLAQRSSELSATAKQNAATAAEQATSAAEVSTTVAEIRETSNASSNAAQAVVEAAEQAAENGRRGADAIAAAVAAMTRVAERVEGIATKILQLSEQNVQIGEIVATVADLAEQSNLLAVNASIEAAKAGEQGRGFAVVASEVRNLAEQSKRATQQIRGILTDVQKATASAVMATEEGSKGVTEG
jgi:methyl-accepting chemotaxis protein